MEARTAKAATVPEARYLRLLSEKYPTREDVCERLIHLEAELGLPKGIEHFMSDLHGEYGTFFHILNNCSGVIREKVEYVFGNRLSAEEQAEFCTLIYYPREKIEQLMADGRVTPEWYWDNLARLLELAKLMSFKYPLEKVSGFIPARFDSVIVELMNTRPEADPAQFTYHKRLLEEIVACGSGAEFIGAFTVLVKRLAVDWLHIVGDFFDRGSRPDAILDQIMRFHDLDIQWGNHDILWMGAACGSEASIANVVRNNLRYNNTDVLEKGYAIGLRPLTLMATRQYPDEEPVKAAERAISLMMFKLEGQIIRRRPEFLMEERALLDRIDYDRGTVTIEGREYELNQKNFPTIDPKDPYRLSDEEAAIMAGLRSSFLDSEPLHRHIEFLYRKGSVYTRFNGNLLFHACVPMQEDGSFTAVTMGGRTLSGRAYLDFVDAICRRAWQKRDLESLDYMWYFWCGRLSPFSGREFKTFERMLVDDESTWEEPDDAYFVCQNDPATSERLLSEFGLDPARGHIINGHVPVKKGQSPVKANGKAIVIDGGFCHAYHKKTGLSGFTLISNSRGLRLLAHQQIADVRTALKENRDIESVSETVELQSYNSTIGDTDEGAAMKAEIADLRRLLDAYQSGELRAADS
ncbi:MAG: fructose-1,6-bisphosphatase [Schwartzia sp.]|nr:fructose-1,6-bisphosphatase [Schwartzia sp. (in: firmicutes)]